MASQDGSFMQELLATFRGEAKEHLQRIVAVVVQMERATPASYARHCGQLLKELHALKGAARAVSFDAMERLCHGMESLFSTLASGRAGLTADEFDLLHQACQTAEQLLTDSSGRAKNRAATATRQLAQLTDRVQSSHLTAAESRPEVSRAAQAKGQMFQPASSAPGEVPELAASEQDVIRVKSASLDEIRHHVESLLSVDLQFQREIAELLNLAEEAGAPVQTGTHAMALRCRQIGDALTRISRSFATSRARLLDATMETALAPVSSAVTPLPGLARNLARLQGKEVRLELEGGSIQVDRRVLDVVRDALIHLVTNAVDHGIEAASVRTKQGKPAAGQIMIKIAPGDNRQIAMTVSDDGIGMDIARLTSAAEQNGAIESTQAELLTEQEKLRLALRSGVSTCDEVTQSSGRGVGLAIVAERVASVGGSLSIESVRGKGTSFHLTLPVSLAAMRGLVLRVSKSLLVLPLFDVERVMKLKQGDIKRVENKETLVDEEQVIPVIRLHTLLNLELAAQPGHEPVVVIVTSPTGRVALLVDEVVAEQEILPKGLGRQIRRMRFVTGAAQLDDQSLAPILGLKDILAYGMRSAENLSSSANAGSADSEQVHILVVEDSITSRLLLKHILENAGYQVDTAEDGVDALSRMRQKDFHAVVTDVEMPNLDGLALTKQLRADPRTAEMPIVLVTSLSSDEEKQRGLLAGADAYVVKGSFDQDNLVATLRRFV